MRVRETEARPGGPCWDWICGLEYMSNTRKAHAGTLAAEIRRQKRCADAEGLASKLCEMTGGGVLRGGDWRPKEESNELGPRRTLVKLTER
jgi:hypothetical protein